MSLDTIVTLYPERWDKGNEQQLYLHILESISDDRHIHKSIDKVGMDLDIDLVAKAILKACMSFEAKALVPCINPDAILNGSECGPLKRVVLPYTEAFSASIAQLVSFLHLMHFFSYSPTISMHVVGNDSDSLYNHNAVFPSHTTI